MCDHPSFGSEAGDAHVETCDGHFDDPNRDDEDHFINRAELMDLDQSLVCPEFRSAFRIPISVFNTHGTSHHKCVLPLLHT